jgi:hypothetical protein
MATIHVRCPAIDCRQVLNVPAESRGLLVTCPFCKRPLRIPQQKHEVAPAAPPSTRPKR